MARRNYRGVFASAGYRRVAVTLPYHDMDPRLGKTSLLKYDDNGADLLNTDEQIKAVPDVIVPSMLFIPLAISSSFLLYNVPVADKIERMESTTDSR